MYRLLIVDDEKAVRERLSEYDWASLGFTVAATCEHGLAALKLMQEQSVDALLTDIHMPIMSGIDLIKQVNQRYPWVSTVVLTGYDEFSYVRTCLRSNVFDYILKPIDDAELAESFSRLASEIGAAKARRQRYAALERKNRLITSSLRKKFLGDFLFNSMTPESINENAAYSEISLERPPYTVLIFRPDIGGDAEAFYGGSDERDLVTFALDNMLTEYTEAEDDGYIWIDPVTTDAYLLACGEPADELPSLAEKVRDVIYKVAQLLRTTVTCAVGCSVNRVCDVFQSQKSAASLLAGRHEPDSILTGASAPAVEPHIRCGDDEPSSVPSGIEAQKLKQITRAALEYVDKNFMNSITLEDIAACVYLSPTYISYLFKTEVKMNFIAYLTMKRMEKAKELLRDPRLKIYEVSSAVGYENSRYFSSIFKKYTGQTPFEYRSGAVEL